MSRRVMTPPEVGSEHKHYRHDARVRVLSIEPGPIRADDMWVRYEWLGRVELETRDQTLEIGSRGRMPLEVFADLFRPFGASPRPLWVNMSTRGTLSRNDPAVFWPEEPSPGGPRYAINYQLKMTIPALEYRALGSPERITVRIEVE